MKLVLAVLAATALSSCQKETPGSEAQGQIVAVEPTHLLTALNSSPVRWRWRVQLAPPLTLPGEPNSYSASYSQVKTFSFTVADTAVFRVGTRISFSYQALPWSAPQWYSLREAMSTGPIPPHFELPEVTLSNVRVL